MVPKLQKVRTNCICPLQQMLRMLLYGLVIRTEALSKDLFSAQFRG